MILAQKSYFLDSLQELGFIEYHCMKSVEIQPKYSDWILRISAYSVRVRENTDQN